MIAITVKTLSGNSEKGRILFKQVDESASSTPVITIEIDDKRVSVGAVDLVRVVAALTGIKVEV